MNDHMNRFGRERSEEDMRFLREILEVCRKHGKVIGHQDIGGAFQIDDITDQGIAWLADASRDDVWPK